MPKISKEMDEVFEQEVYSKNTIEFVTVSNEFCTFLENVRGMEKRMLVESIQRLLPLLYLKATLLPEIENQLDESLERFVSETDYILIQNNLIEILGSDDDYVRMFDAEYSEGHEPVNASVSENLADAYQNLKDFVMNYRTGISEIMNDALWECKLNFEQYWGEAILNAMKAIHMMKYTKINWEDDTYPHEHTHKSNKKRKNFFDDLQDQYLSE